MSELIGLFVVTVMAESAVMFKSFFVVKIETRIRLIRKMKNIGSAQHTAFLFRFKIVFIRHRLAFNEFWLYPDKIDILFNFY